ncbi:MAG TPA: substrate-binding domain-containing protein [Candidatus Binatia bacterium]|jgi:molybdate transport system substrate-binding protein|nr:substrate-binding domain-containing protein [Candidatus Binatia bacterium]
MMSNAEINVFSAGAVQPGIVKVIEAFRNASPHHVKITFATAPIILKRIGAPDGLDVVIAPPAVLDEWVKAAKTTAADRVTIGRIGVGVMVRESAPLPRIASVDDFKQALLSAESVVYNQASTGIYLEKLFERLGIAEQLKPKTVRYPDAAAVLDHIAKGNGAEIGLGATTVIIEGVNKGLKFVGPLPPEIQNYTTYAAAVVNAGSASDAAREFVRFLTGPVAQKVFASAGIQ